MPMSKKQQPLWLSLILFAMSGCATGLTGVEVKGDYCRIAGPIYYDGKADSTETVQQIEKHNSQWACTCENDCPQKGT